MTTTAHLDTQAIQKITKRAWKQLAKLDDPDDAEAIRETLIDLLEALDTITDPEP